MDSYDKLKLYGIVVNGCIDGVQDSPLLFTSYLLPVSSHWENKGTLFIAMQMIAGFICPYSQRPPSSIQQQHPTNTTF